MIGNFLVGRKKDQKRGSGMAWSGVCTWDESWNEKSMAGEEGYKSTFAMTHHLSPPTQYNLIKIPEQPVLGSVVVL